MQGGLTNPPGPAEIVEVDLSPEAAAALPRLGPFGPTCAVLAWLSTGERTICKPKKLTPKDLENVPSPEVLRRLKDRRAKVVRAKMTVEAEAWAALTAQCTEDGGDVHRTLTHAVEVYLKGPSGRVPSRDVDGQQDSGVEKTNALTEANPEGAATNSVVPLAGKRTFREKVLPAVPDVQGTPVTEEKPPEAIVERPPAPVVPIGRGLADIPYGSRPLISDVIRTLRMHEEWMGVFGTDTYRGDTIVKCKAPPWENATIGPWTSLDCANTRTWFGDKYRAIVSKDVLDDAVRIVASKNIFHSLVNELRSFEWDRKPRLDRWIIDHCGADETDLTKLFTRMFTISAIARAMKPGCTAQHVLVLEGPTGISKTRALRAIAGHEHYCDSPLDISNIMNAPALLSGVWWFVFDELAALDRASVEQINQFITIDRDEYMLKHKNEKARVPRSCVLAGTTTRHEWLMSPDGARRWWPIRIRGLGKKKKIDIDGIELNRAQILAEAVYAYDMGEPWYFDDEENEAEAEEHRSSRIAVDEHEEPITAYIAKHAYRLQQPGAFVTVAEILSKALSLTPDQWNRHKLRVAAILTDRLGWQRGKKKISTPLGRFVPYEPPDADTEPTEFPGKPE